MPCLKPICMNESQMNASSQRTNPSDGSESCLALRSYILDEEYVPALILRSSRRHWPTMTFALRANGTENEDSAHTFESWKDGSFVLIQLQTNLIGLSLERTFSIAKLHCVSVGNKWGTDICVTMTERVKRRISR
jgi:hypothetical protein